MREIKKIIVHCSVSSFGDAKIIDGWHRELGFSEIGYHYVILNGKRHSKDKYCDKTDGNIELGRDIQKQGAHCKYQNKNSIGICLIGNKSFTKKQFRSLLVLIERLKDRFGFLPVYGHYEMPSGISQGKTCPNFDMDKFRRENTLYA